MEGTGGGASKASGTQGHKADPAANAATKNPENLCESYRCVYMM